MSQLHQLRIVEVDVAVRSGVPYHGATIHGHSLTPGRAVRVAEFGHRLRPDLGRGLEGRQVDQPALDPAPGRYELGDIARHRWIGPFMRV